MGLGHIIATMESWLNGEPVWPYRKIIDAWGPDFEMYRLRWHREIVENSDSIISTFMAAGPKFDEAAMERRLSRGVGVMRLRDEWVSRFGFAIPCAELLDELAQADHVIEVGAGTGYMTRLMRNRGINAQGSDFEDRGPNGYRFETGKWDNEMFFGVAGKTMVRRHRDATIFCSWPTLRSTWFRQMLKAMRIGQRLIVVREDACAEDSAWEYLADCFDEEKTIAIPAFEHMNDYAQVCVKKRQRVRHAGIALHP